MKDTPLVHRIGAPTITRVDETAFALALAQPVRRTSRSIALRRTTSPR
ncbi:hypothetical protein PPMP20_23225 [Paraburkholderia phymatum]|nr:hypothetical protein [Paraburkholderia phymatum]